MARFRRMVDICRKIHYRILYGHTESYREGVNNTLKAALFNGPREVRLIEIDEPRVNAGMIRCDSVISHWLPLSEIDEAFALFGKERVTR